jgi:hypothetical protein
MGAPNIRKGTPFDWRWAAIDKPYGPAPIMATSVKILMKGLQNAYIGADAEVSLSQAEGLVTTWLPR